MLVHGLSSVLNPFQSLELHTDSQKLQQNAKTILQPQQMTAEAAALLPQWFGCVMGRPQQLTNNLGVFQLSPACIEVPGMNWPRPCKQAHGDLVRGSNIVVRSWRKSDHQPVNTHSICLKSLKPFSP